MCKYCDEQIKIEKKKDSEGKPLNETESFLVIEGEIISDREFKSNRGGNYTEVRIKRPKNVEQARLYIDNGYGLSYVNINYCFMCGRKL